MTVAVFLTPTLLVGRHHHVHHVYGIEDVDSVEEAVDVIRNGGTAALPDDAWDMARTVLIAFGAGTRWADATIRWAQGRGWCWDVPDTL